MDQVDRHPFRGALGGPLEIGIDGEALALDPPLEFRILPGALRVRIPHDSARAFPGGGRRTTGLVHGITAVLRTATGRPVAIGR